jgi:proline iminopeptidase
MRTFPAVLLLGLAASAISSATVAANERSDGFVNAGDGARLYYVEKGTGPDVLVAPVALYLEPHLLDELAAKRRVIFYDPRNRGRSDAADLSSVSLDRQIEDLEALRKALGIEKMALLGWSGLGMEMAVYALRYPQHVTRLIQVSAVPPAASIMQEFGDSRGDRVDQTALDDLYRRADAGEFDNKPQEYCRRVNALTDPGNFADTDLAKHVPDVCVYENEWPKNLWPYFGALLPSFGDYDWRDDMHEMNIPRLVIHGREDGIPLAGAEAWAAGYADTRLLILSPSGHFPYIEQKADVVRAINAFLDGGWPADALAVASPEL